jgi:hypothetical protein
MKTSERREKGTPVNTWKTVVVDAPFEGDVGIAPGVRTHEGGLQLLEDLDVELRVRDDVGGWDR